MYGANIAAFPLKMLVEIVNISNKNQLNVSKLENVQSGAALDYQINVEIIDFYDKTVTSLNSEYFFYYQFFRVFFIKVRFLLMSMKSLKFLMIQKRTVLFASKIL